MTDTICELEKSLSYTFRDRSLAKRALTRKAYALENGIENDQEILRTLGDAVLKAILIDLLIVQGASSRSEITMKKSELESSEGLSCIAKKIHLGSYLLLGAGEEKMGLRNRQYVLSESFEALIGALYQDGGYESTKNTVKSLFEENIQILCNEKEV